MLPIRSIVLAVCASLAIAAPLSGNVCPSSGDCPTCYGLHTPDLRDIVCNSESAFIVATGVDTDGERWTSPRRWQDIFGAHGHRYAVEHFPIDERHWDKADSECRTYYAKPAYEITKGQAPRRVQTPGVAGFKMNPECSCIGLIAEAGYAVVAFKSRAINHFDELETQALSRDVVVVPLPRGEFKIPTCAASFNEDKTTISTEKLPAVFANDEAELECDKVSSCPKCEVLHSTEQLRDICQSSKELMIVKRALSRDTATSPNAPWHMPKIEVYVDKDSTQEDSYETRIKVSARTEKGCAKPNFHVLTALTANLEGKSMLRGMQLGEQCQCDFIRKQHGYALLRSERELSETDALGEQETILMIPRGQYIIPQCPREDESERSDSDEDEKAQCEAPEDSCPICEEYMSEVELEETIKSDDALVVKMQTNSHLKKSEDSDEVRCATAEVVSVMKGQKENIKSEVTFTLPEKCRCAAMSNYGRQFYAVVKKDAIEGERLEKLPLNEKVYIVGQSFRSHNLLKRWLNPESIDEAEDRSGYDGYASYAPPAYAAPPPAYAPAYAAYAPPPYVAPAYVTSAWMNSYGSKNPSIAVSYSMPITIPIVTAKSTYSKGYDGKTGYGSDYGKTSGTQIVETKVEATYTTVVGIQPADSYPSAGPTYQAGYPQAPGYVYKQ
ncbi:uncharacterized protein LOC100898154 [Galendromus occidentalis]|uniref:Uncharacterized protein LOC100898154 n=1 Tax=Galendromus occidentalis TaxID=34638 RepID=A0AAJ7PAW2_9ACAR|nr:uncharacterized protein LOC100898154 [Galendromus occidentalis]